MKLLLSVLVGITFSNELVQEIYLELSKQPFSTVAPLITKMQNEVAHQSPAPVGQPSSPPTQSLPDKQK